jgi:hypothetical protein
MPRKLLRLLAFFLLALSVPVQGMAAVTAGQCMAFGHHSGDAAESGHDAHAHDDAEAAHDHASHGHGDDTAKHDDGGSSSHCGPCAACCASASIAGPVNAAFPSVPSDRAYVLSQLQPPGVQPDGLDRPPLAL